LTNSHESFKEDIVNSIKIYFISILVYYSKSKIRTFVAIRNKFV